MTEIQTTSNTLETELRRRSEMVRAECQVVIENDADYYAAEKKAAEVRSLVKAIEDYWHPVTHFAYTNWQMLLGKEKGMLSPVKEGLAAIGRLLVAYRAEREKRERERQEAEYQQQIEDADMAAFELAEEGVPQETIDAVVEMKTETPFQAQPTQELRTRTKFKPDYIVTIKKIEDEDGNEIEQWDQVDPELLIPSTKAHKDAIIANAKARAFKTNGKAIDGFNVSATEKPIIRRAK